MRLGRRRFSIEPPLQLVMFTTSCRCGRDAIHESAASSVGRQVRPGDVEFVVAAVVGAVANQHHHQRIGRFGLFGDLGEVRA